MFPKNAKEIVEKVRVAIKEQFNVDVEVLAFGDGAFKIINSNLELQICCWLSLYSTPTRIAK